MKKTPHWNTKVHTEKDEKEIYNLYMEAYVRLEKAKYKVEKFGWAWEHGKLHSLMCVFNFLIDNHLNFKRDLQKYRKNLHKGNVKRMKE